MSSAAVTLPKGLVPMAAVFIVLAMILSLAVWIGVPLLIGLLVFPALGLTGWGLAGAWAALICVWFALLAAVTHR